MIRALEEGLPLLLENMKDTVEAILDGVCCELSTGRADPRACPLRDGTTGFVRYLNAYAREVEENSCRLVESDLSDLGDFAEYHAFSQSVEDALESPAHHWMTGGSDDYDSDGQPSLPQFATWCPSDSDGDAPAGALE